MLILQISNLVAVDFFMGKSCYQNSFPLLVSSLFSFLLFDFAQSSWYSGEHVESLAKREYKRECVPQSQLFLEKNICSHCTISRLSIN